MVTISCDYDNNIMNELAMTCVKVVLNRLTKSDLMSNKVLYCEPKRLFEDNNTLRELTENYVIIKQNEKPLNKRLVNGKRKINDENDGEKPKRVTRSRNSNRFNLMDDKPVENEPKFDTSCTKQLEDVNKTDNKHISDTNMFNDLIVDHNDKQLLNCLKTIKPILALNRLNKPRLLEIMRTNSFRCVWPECGLRCKHPHILAVHYRTHTGDKPFKCDKCEQRFASITYFNWHKKMGKNVTHCEQYMLNKNRESRLIFVCNFDDCCKRFETSLALEYHYRRHVKCSFDCFYCEKSFFNKLDLKNHLVTHQTKNHNCFYCEKSFTNKHDLENHFVIHRTKYRPFKCYENNCGKQFSSLYFLVCHQTSSHPNMQQNYNIIDYS